MAIDAPGLRSQLKKISGKPAVRPPNVPAPPQAPKPMQTSDVQPPPFAQQSTQQPAKQPTRPLRSTSIRATPVAGALGAEITGVDLESLSLDSVRLIRELLVEHEVLFFREQNITRAAHKALAESLGPVQSHPAYDTVTGFPEIAILESTPEKPTKIEAWHTDMTFRTSPPMATCLRARVIPPRGGDTMWASTTSAFEALSLPMQEFLSSLTAVHSFEHGFRESLAETGGRRRLSQAVAENPPVEHPVITTHPESGRKAIYVNSLFTTHIVGLEKAESAALLNFLYQHIQTPEFSCRFQWAPHSIALWDNRSTQHKPINDYFPAHRQLERITIDGDKPLRGLRTS